MAEAWSSIKELAQSVIGAKTSAFSLTQEALKRAREDEFDSMLEVYEERALERARHIDELVEKGEYAGRLAGVPFVAKDNFLTFGGKTTAASTILGNFEAPYQSTAVEKLENEGAICIGKANLDAFAHGSSTENSDFKVTKNPRNPEYVPGGSSGGSAAVVAAGIVPFALGTDTGGSIRLPASFCGVVGMKPTYGLVSRSGVVAMGSSTDVIGPLANSVEDSALVLDVMAGPDPQDSTTIARFDGKYTNLDLSDLTIGVIKEHMADGVDVGVTARVQEAIKKLEESGATIKEVSLPSSDLALATYYVLVPAEVSSNLARYDGIRYGYSDADATNLEETYVKSRSNGFGDEAKRRIMIGNYVLSSGYYDAYYKRAQQVRTLLIQEYENAIRDCDVLLGPVAARTAFKIGENAQDPLQMYLIDVMTVTANLVGAPAISVPIGSVNDLPVGLHILGAQTHDREVLAVAKRVEGLVS